MQSQNADWFSQLFNEVVDPFNGNIAFGDPAMLAEQLLKKTKLKINDVLSAERKENIIFKNKLYRQWQKPLDLFEFFLNIIGTIGKNFCEELADEPSRKNDFVFVVLARLHGRSCQIGQEVLTLLQHGFADGAEARWRTLHEISCISLFIRKHGQNVAKRFFQHQVIESFNHFEVIQKHISYLNYEPLTKNEFLKLKTEYDSLLRKYGKSFKHQYGWVPLDLFRKKRVTFADLEKDVKLEPSRPYYKMACYNIHSGSKGILFKLGLPSGETSILAGPSSYGLAQPAHNSAISMLQTTTSLLFTRQKIEDIIKIRFLLRLVEEIGRVF